MAETCIRHPDREAVNRCRNCGAWICSECKFSDSTGVYCSPACSTEYRATHSHADAVGGGASVKRSSGRLRRLLIMILLVALAYFVLKHLGWLPEGLGG